MTGACPCFSPLFIIKTLQSAAFARAAAYLSGKVLDIGCGARPYRGYVACRSYVGMDESAAVKPDVVARGDALPCRDKAFDSAICTEVLEHAPEPAAVLGEAWRVLTEGGCLYVTVPQTWALHYEPADYWRFTRYGIARLLEKSGFSVLRIERIGGVFSLAGQRIIDVLWSACATLCSFLPRRQAERVASAVVMPANLLFFCIGKAADRIDQRDALGWAVVARKT